MTGQDLTRLAAALLLGAAIAFPLGLWVAGQREAPPPRERPPAEMRGMFSPDVRGDPYVLDQLRQQVERLEAYCRDTGKMCADARGARERLVELNER
jgi:hypothetical protein